MIAAPPPAAPSSRPYAEHAPPPALAAIVDRFWTLQTSAAGSHDAVVLPDGCVDVLFSRCEARAFVVGAMTTAHVAPAGPSDLVAIRFRPGGAARFFRLPLNELTDAHVDLGDLGRSFANDARIVLEELAARRTHEPLVAFVHARSRATVSDTLVDAAVRALVGARAPSVATLATHLGVTRQHLTRRVRAAVGLSPKELARVVRMQRVLPALASARTDLAQVAVAYGFYDQPHLGHEVRALTGMTPAVVAARVAAGSISPITSAYEMPKHAA